ncbi:MAG: hypothetical protein AAGU77_11325 [Bacillota bacterium]
MIEQLMQEDRFDFMNAADKQFVCEFTHALSALGYTFGNAIGSGYCWGRYMLIFTKAGVKSKKVVARIYLRQNGIALRLFFSDVSRHAAYISAAPDFIRDVFTGPYGDCKHCKGDTCMFRKDYAINGVQYEKCNSLTFGFNEPDMDRLPGYLALFQEFYPAKRA